MKRGGHPGPPISRGPGATRKPVLMLNSGESQAKRNQVPPREQDHGGEQVNHCPSRRACLACSRSM